MVASEEADMSDSFDSLGWCLRREDRCHDGAERARTAAQEFRDPGLQKLMREMAEIYETHGHIQGTPNQVGAIHST